MLALSLFLLSLGLGSQLVEWCHPQLRWVFPLQLTQIDEIISPGHVQKLISKVILDPVKLALKYELSIEVKKELFHS